MPEPVHHHIITDGHILPIPVIPDRLRDDEAVTYFIQPRPYFIQQHTSTLGNPGFSFYICTIIQIQGMMRDADIDENGMKKMEESDARASTESHQKRRMGEK